ncbi:hypothetical protein SprV_0301279500 [Sparganum proliferum]
MSTLDCVFIQVESATLTLLESTRYHRPQLGHIDDRHTDCGLKTYLNMDRDRRRKQKSTTKTCGTVALDYLRLP